MTQDGGVAFSREDFESLSSRMRAYERQEPRNLRPGLTTIIRLTSKKASRQPFASEIISAVQHAAVRLCEEVQGVKMAYTYAGEISLVLDDTKETWFGGDQLKIVSASTSMATYYSNDHMDRMYWFPRMVDGQNVRREPLLFEALVFQVPRDEIVNNLISRQQEGMRNSVASLAKLHFTDKELHRKSIDAKVEMMRGKNVLWEALPNVKRLGACVVKEFEVLDGEEERTIAPMPVRRSKWNVDDDVPVFADDMAYVRSLIDVRFEI